MFQFNRSFFFVFSRLALVFSRCCTMYQLTWLPAIKPGLFHFWQSQCGLLMNSAGLLYLNESCLHFNLDCLRTTSLFRDGQVNALLIRAQLKAALKEKNLCLKRTANVTKNILQECVFLYSVSSKLRWAGSVPRRAYLTNFALKVFHRRFWHKLCGENKEGQAHIFARFPNVCQGSSQGNACKFFHEHCL